MRPVQRGNRVSQGCCLQRPPLPIFPSPPAPRTWPSLLRAGDDSRRDRPSPETPSLGARAGLPPNREFLCVREVRYRASLTQAFGMFAGNHRRCRIGRIDHEPVVRVYPGTTGKDHVIRAPAALDGRNPGRCALVPPRDAAAAPEGFAKWAIVPVWSMWSSVMSSNLISSGLKPSLRIVSS